MNHGHLKTTPTLVRESHLHSSVLNCLSLSVRVTHSNLQCICYSISLNKNIECENGTKNCFGHNVSFVSVTIVDSLLPGNGPVQVEPLQHYSYSCQSPVLNALEHMSPLLRAVIPTWITQYGCKYPQIVSTGIQGKDPIVTCTIYQLFTRSPGKGRQCWKVQGRWVAGLARKAQSWAGWSQLGRLAARRRGRPVAGLARASRAGWLQGQQGSKGKTGSSAGWGPAGRTQAHKTKDQHPRECELRI